MCFETTVVLYAGNLTPLHMRPFLVQVWSWNQYILGAIQGLHSLRLLAPTTQYGKAHPARYTPIDRPRDGVFLSIDKQRW